ncbi:hypothetical protein MSAN_01073600 [Mycena sanguinolenta]|uniref:Uncharacterized protein n=1 Tax=Mycena sanguinolenta TaxID=230812 RepID=A0A8H6YT51_9AGAR|nr:hypothetical protein MSAN_01073600 [Mycena sanguinolenta]
MDSGSPLLPPELERQIFETAVDLHPEIIPNLLLVAARVLEWIEPLRYRTFTLAGPPETCHRFHVLARAIASKPAQFIRDNVWHVFADWDFGQRTLDTFIPFCTGIKSLVIFNPYPGMLSQLETARPRHLAGPIESLFHDHVHHTSRGVDLTLPLFSALTHLDVFGTIYLESSSWTSWSSLALLPTLTHLAVIEISYRAAAAALAICPKLHVIISMHSDARTHSHLVSNSVEDIDDSDPRFLSMVLASNDYAADWEAGVQGGIDFWARADAFVGMRRRGEVEPKSRYWIEERDGV